MSDDMSDVATTALLRLVGAYSTDAIRRYRELNPESFVQMAKLFAADGAKFDFCVRDVTGFAPTIELLVVAGEEQLVIASQVFRRRETPPERDEP